MHIFISYAWDSRKDLVRSLANRLVNEKYKIWLDIHEMKTGHLDTMMYDGINESYLFLCCITSEYCKRDNCMKELRLALDLKKEIIYIIFDDYDKTNREKVFGKFGTVRLHMAGKMYFNYKDEKSIFEAINLFYNHHLTSTNAKPDLLQDCVPQGSREVNYQVINRSCNISIYAFSPNRMVYLKNKNKILVTDGHDNSLKIVDLDGQISDSKKIDKHLSYPAAICLSNKEEIFVSSWKKKGIYVFDSELNYIRRFGKKQILFVDFMKCDCANSFLYSTNFDQNSVTKYDYDSEELVKQTKIDAPIEIEILNDQLFICSLTKYEENFNNKTLKRITSGSNCIFVLNKNSLEIIKKFSFENWLKPSGLQFDSNENILTLAYRLNNQIIDDSRSLFLLDKNGNYLKETYLNDVQLIIDMLLVNNRLFILYEEQRGLNFIKIIEFSFN